MVMLETSFPHTKWLRHGDPLFSILYNLMAILAIWIGGEKENITSLWVGVVLHMRVYLSYNMLTTNYYLWIMILNMRNISNFLLLNNGSASAWMSGRTLVSRHPWLLSVSRSCSMLCILSIRIPRCSNNSSHPYHVLACETVRIPPFLQRAWTATAR